jgi:hypothetical protein
VGGLKQKRRPESRPRLACLLHQLSVFQDTLGKYLITGRLQINLKKISGTGSTPVPEPLSPWLES